MLMFDILEYKRTRSTSMLDALLLYKQYTATKGWKAF